MNILVAGDFYPAGRLSKLADASPEDIFCLFEPIIKTADLAIVNLEAPLCRGGEAITKTGPAMKAHPDSAQFLKKAGFDLVTLANNHIYDFGDAGLAETFETLESQCLKYVGAGWNLEEASRPFVASVGDLTVAVLNFAENEWSTTHDDSPGANPVDAVKNFQAIRDAKCVAECVVIICHGGHENYSLPSPRMKELFRFYVEAGASAVINHHTHCVSGYEIYRGAPIFYSLGNFLFDRPDLRTGAWTEGMAVELLVSGSGIDFKFHHFEQCTSEREFRLCEGIDHDRRTRELNELNKTIANDLMLEQAFSDFIDGKTRQYRRYLEPSTMRLIDAAQARGLLPSILSRRQRVLLLNLFRCEAHREVIIEILERDVGNSR